MKLKETSNITTIIYIYRKGGKSTSEEIKPYPQKEIKSKIKNICENHL
jgi:hypothetical protein